MKRGIIFLVVLVFSFNFASAEDTINNTCKISIELQNQGISNTEELFDYLIKKYKNSTNYSILGDNRDEKYIDSDIREYINCFADDKEKYNTLIEMFFINYMYTLYDLIEEGRFGSNYTRLIERGNLAITDLETYGKNNPNYYFYLSRFSLFLGLGYYNNIYSHSDSCDCHIYSQIYKNKALQYFTTANSYKDTKFIFNDKLFLDEKNRPVIKYYSTEMLLDSAIGFIFTNPMKKDCTEFIEYGCWKILDYGYDIWIWSNDI